MVKDEDGDDATGDGAPDIPTISAVTPDDTLLVDNKLRLECKSRSNSLPAVHGLQTKVWWQDGQGNDITTGSRFFVNSEQELQVDALSRGDKDLKFACVVADETGGKANYVRSRSSDSYTVLPEYPPLQSDLKVSPHFEDGARIGKRIGERLDYKCEADCHPECEVKWMYKADTQGAKYGEVQGLEDRSVLVNDGVGRSDPGTYRCRAKNKHSEAPVKTSFVLELLYLETPQVYINEKPISNISAWEKQDAVELKCVFDANPRPSVIWRSPSGKEILNSVIEGPEKAINADSGVSERLYTSSLYLHSLTCEDSGIYSCHGSSENTEVEGRMNVNVKCPPKPLDAADKGLAEEYAWQIPNDLKVKFVMRGWPAPKITRVSSSLNGERRREIIGQNILVNKMNPYEGKPWLTLFQLTSKRNLTQADSGRTYTMEFFSSDYDLKYSFKIRLRGPPREVYNITLENIRHNSVDVFWQAGFDGGEKQMFTVEYRKKGDNGEVTTDWVVAAKDIPVTPRGLWQTTKITGLQASTEYSCRVKASNILGTSATEFVLKTRSAPSGGLSAGAIVGIVFACLIFVLIVAFVLLYCMADVRDTLRSLIKRDEEKPTQNGGVSSGSDKPKKNPIVRMKKMVQSIPKKLKKDYNTVPAKDVEGDEDDYSDEFDDDDPYMNADELQKPKTDEIVYANASAIRKNAEDKKKNEGREKNDDGLIYVSVDHKNSNVTPSPKNNNNNKSAGSNKGSNEPAVLFTPQEDSVEYSEIDFSKTKSPLKNGVHQEVTAEVNPTLKQEEVVVAVQPDGEEDATSAVDGGADVEAEDGGADLSTSDAVVVVPESKFGTAV
ncbi:cell adhesion molecule-like protein 2 [Elysia marginata]|uniref:Cell adhesion molecule-like protein 2 n=1 Tax=Elysia marginata TaxID=1093978 RepID=A0AAV4FZF0_9GAST|nr:cell adhesion molecule-like protein 2 [Elysia marginata]